MHLRNEQINTSARHRHAYKRHYAACRHLFFGTGKPKHDRTRFVHGVLSASVSAGLSVVRTGIYDEDDGIVNEDRRERAAVPITVYNGQGSSVGSV